MGILAIIFSCKKEEADKLSSLNDLAAFPYDQLSEYGLLVEPLVLLKPIEEALPYDLNAPLFSDYAQKTRFIYIPDGKQAIYNKEDIIDFPVGTIIVKTFYFLADLSDSVSAKKILETRLLVRQELEWKAYDYIWNNEQTEASYSIVSKVITVGWTHTDSSMRSTNYVVPNQNKCKSCHSLDSILVAIGPKGLNMDRLYTYPNGTANQLDKMASKNWFATDTYETGTGMPSWMDASASLDLRARAYLDINCAHCHNPRENANNSGLFLYYTNTDSSSLGICKPPVAAGGGSGNFQYAIVPGMPDESIMIHRMNSLAPQVMMPELGRSVIHREGLDLIRLWISSLPGEGCH